MTIPYTFESRCGPVTVIYELRHITIMHGKKTKVCGSWAHASALLLALGVALDFSQNALICALEERLLLEENL